MLLDVNEGLLTSLFYDLYTLPTRELYEEEGIETDENVDWILKERERKGGRVVEEDLRIYRLELEHFAYLSRLLCIPLNDLTFYVFPFLLGCKGEVALSIMEFEFVKGILRVLGTRCSSCDDFYHPIHGSESSSPPVCGHGMAEEPDRPVGGGGGVYFQKVREQFHSIWCALHICIEHSCKELCANTDATQTFYNFLYTFVLRREEREECIRRQLAVELWEMFFTPFPSSSLRNESEQTSTRRVADGAKTMHREASAQTLCPMRYLAVFTQLPSWIAFVQSPSFYAPHTQEDGKDNEEDDETGEESVFSPLFGENTISFDMWQQLWFFAKLPTYENYDFCGPWPNAMDDFVKYLHRLETRPLLPL